MDAREKLIEILQKARARPDGGCRIILTVEEWRAAIAAISATPK